MEEWQESVIGKSKPKLINTTVCDGYFLSHFYNSFSKCDVDTLNDLPSSVERCSKFYDLIQTREKGFENLVSALRSTVQTGVLKILEDGSTEIGKGGEYLKLGSNGTSETSEPVSQAPAPAEQEVPMTQVANEYMAQERYRVQYLTSDDVEQDKVLKIVKAFLHSYVNDTIHRDLVDSIVCLSDAALGFDSETKNSLELSQSQKSRIGKLFDVVRSHKDLVDGADLLFLEVLINLEGNSLLSKAIRKRISDKCGGIAQIIP